MKRYDACTGRRYQDRDGNDKTAWTRIGTMFVKDDGKMSVKFDALPLPNDKGEVWVTFFEPKPRDGEAPKTQSQGSAPRKASPIDDDIPFAACM